MSPQEPTAGEALAQARLDINEARGAKRNADTHRQSRFARSTIDHTATTLLDPGATPREIVAAHCFLCEALALDGRANTCGAELINTEQEAAALPDEDQKWLGEFLAARRQQPPRARTGHDYGITL